MSALGSREHLAYPPAVAAYLDAEEQRRWLEVITPGTALDVADDHLWAEPDESVVVTSFATLHPTSHPSCERPPVVMRRGHIDSAAIAWTLDKYEGVQLLLHRFDGRGAR